ncbi:MAG TPA: gfo/Idh/MocA family oxidoreductase, partial [Bacteroidia bacterium]|nr:gfo/Idh/MocA family oxidoreductase [Bacteroidia bacterium]
VIIDSENGKPAKQIYFEAPSILPTNAIKMELEAFANSILTNSTPPVSADDGYKALDVAYKVIEKMKLSSNFIDEPAI